MPKCKQCGTTIPTGNLCDKHKPVSRSATKQKAGVEGKYQGSQFEHHQHLSSNQTRGGGGNRGGGPR